ncbi:MAG: peptide-methionine (R)-S-oxide reductase MsrB [Candidatus Poseidoniaceae archaeon]|nr:peptide-methionine (R)-S-oxide reductase MsrB [Candidatus Poseidoniaceae archaeon]
MKIAVMALSGGMDSTSLLLRLLNEKYQVYCISYEYGQKHRVEIDRSMLNIEYLKSKGKNVIHEIVDLQSAMAIFNSSLLNVDLEIPEGHYEEDQMKSTVVPNRNAIFSSILYGYALSIAVKNEKNVVIALGVHSGDHAIYPDCRPQFYTALEHAFKLGNWDSEKVSFELPYIDGDKESILRDAEISCNELEVDFEIIFANTNTSYNPDAEGRSSGKSGADIERILAFKAIGRVDPVEYVDSWEVVLANAVEVEKRHKDEYYRNKLTDLQYLVTRQGGTERAFTGIYDDEKRKGVYRCICCEQLLFISEHKFDSGCGWPAFHSESADAGILRIPDNSMGMVRIEVRCSKCDAHLGHVFDDGPTTYGGERYCINSASLDFEEDLN